MNTFEVSDAAAPFRLLLDGPKGRQRIAIAVSVSLHVTLIAALLLSPPGGIAGGGGEAHFRGEGTEAGGEPLTVSLISVASVTSLKSSAQPSTPDPLKLLMRARESALTASPPDPAKSQNSKASLDQLIAAADSKLVRPDVSHASSADATSGKTAASGRGSESAVGGGDIYAQVEPCWKRALDRSRVPVALEVSLDASGRVVSPPRLLDADGEPGAKRVAVERALQAVFACLPYKARAGASLRGTYRLEFGLSNP